MGYNPNMILIRFPDPAAKKEALGKLPGRFSFKSWATGEMVVPEDALAFLAVEGVAFVVEGPAKYGQSISSVRTAAAPAIQ
jgi:hypothetical protein